MKGSQEPAELCRLGRDCARGFNHPQSSCRRHCRVTREGLDAILRPIFLVVGALVEKERALAGLPWRPSETSASHSRLTENPVLLQPHPPFHPSSPSKDGSQIVRNASSLFALETARA